MTNFEQALANPDPAVRRAAVGLIAALGPDASDLIPAVVRSSVADVDRHVNYAAFSAVDRIGAKPEDLAPLYLEMLTTLPKDGPDDPHGFARSLAAWTLGRLSPHGAIGVAALVTVVTDPTDHGDPRYAAAWALERLGPYVKDYVSEIAGVVADDPDYSVRSGCASALGAIGPDAEAAVPTLIAALEETSPLIREEAARALGRIGRSPDQVVPALVEALKDLDALVREYAVESLGKFGGASAAAVPAVIDALRTDTPTIRRKAAIALQNIGSSAKEGIPALIERAARDHSAPVRSAAMAALESFEPGLSESVPQAVDPEQYTQLRQQHLSDDGRVRAGTTWRLALWGPSVDELVPTLARQLLEDDHSDARWAAAWALGRLRTNDPGAIQSLEKAALSDVDPDNRAEAIRALGWIGPEAVSAAATLIQALGDPYDLVRAEAATAVGRIRALEGISALREALSDRTEPVRRRVEASLLHLDGDKGAGSTFAKTQ